MNTSMKFTDIIKSILRLIIYCIITISFEIIFSYFRGTEIKQIKIISAAIYGFLFWILILLMSRLKSYDTFIKNKKPPLH